MNQYTETTFQSLMAILCQHLRKILNYYYWGKSLSVFLVQLKYFFCFIYEIILTKLFENIVSIVDCGNHKLNFCEFPIHGLLLLDVLKHEPKIKMREKKYFIARNKGIHFSCFFMSSNSFFRLLKIWIFKFSDMMLSIIIAA